LWTSRRQFREWADQESGPTPDFCDGCDAVVKGDKCEYCGTKIEKRDGLLRRFKEWLFWTFWAV
jgi:hypothetical protein